MKKLFTLIMFILSSLMFGAEIKVNNISTILPNKIDVNNFSKSFKCK